MREDNKLTLLKYWKKITSNLEFQTIFKTPFKTESKTKDISRLTISEMLNGMHTYTEIIKGVLWAEE